MKKLRQYKRWGIYELNDKEKLEHGFNFAVIHPNNMGCYPIYPSDTDMEIDSMTAAISWIDNY